MWARDCEFFISIWLAISWMILHYRERFLLIHDYIAALIIGFCALACYAAKFRHLHLFNFFMGLWLIAFAALVPVPFAAAQNYVVLGFLLFMLSLVPSNALVPPYDWLEFHDRRKK